MKKLKVLLIGGGGHCKSCIDVIESSESFEVAGIIDVEEKVNTTVLGYKVIGSDKNLQELKKRYDYALITVGQIKSSFLREKLFIQAKQVGYKFPVIIASSAIVSKHAVIGEGTIVMHHVVVNSSAVLGDNNIINTKALIEHDVNIGDHNHISTAAVLNGGVEVGNGCFIGSNTTVSNGISISERIIVGQCSNIYKNINGVGTYVGSPVKKIC